MPLWGRGGPGSVDTLVPSKLGSEDPWRAVVVWMVMVALSCGDYQEHDLAGRELHLICGASRHRVYQLPGERLTAVDAKSFGSGAERKTDATWTGHSPCSRRPDDRLVAAAAKVGVHSCGRHVKGVGGHILQLVRERAGILPRTAPSTTGRSVVRGWYRYRSWGLLVLVYPRIVSLLGRGLC